MIGVAKRDAAAREGCSLHSDLDDAWADEGYALFDRVAQEVLGDLLAHWRTLEGRLLVCPAVWHPNGFAVFVLGDYQGFSVRLHVWAPGASGVLKWHPPVHSHDRHVSSVVLFGQKSDLLWRPRNSDVGNSELIDVVRKTNNIEQLAPSGQTVHLDLQERFIFARGDYFSQPAGIYHEIPPARRQAFATLCVKSEIIPGREQAIVGMLAEGVRIIERRRLSSPERKELLGLLAGGVAWKR
jgi:hypothetical protein